MRSILVMLEFQLFFFLPLLRFLLDFSDMLPVGTVRHDHNLTSTIVSKNKLFLTSVTVVCFNVVQVPGSEWFFCDKVVLRPYASVLFMLLQYSLMWGGVR